MGRLVEETADFARADGPIRWPEPGVGKELRIDVRPVRIDAPESPARGRPNANGADPKVDPTLTGAWIPKDTWHPVSLPAFPIEDRIRRALSPALAPASGSVKRSVRVRRSFPVPPGGSATDLPLASRLKRLHRSGRNLCDASSASDRRNRSMVTFSWRSSRTISPLPAEAFCKGDLEDRTGECRHLEMVWKS
jgi:hypothetical protein